MLIPIYLSKDGLSAYFDDFEKYVIDADPEELLRNGVSCGLPRLIQSGDVILLDGNTLRINSDGLTKFDFKFPTIKQVSEPACVLCYLHKTAKTVKVPYRGADRPLIMFIGEGPGRMEDEEGLPFIGKAGCLLTDELNNLSIDSSKCGFDNVVKCIPLYNGVIGTPDSLAIVTCVGNHLYDEIERRNPKIIVTLGATSSNAILETNEKISHLRGRVYSVTIREKLYRIVPTFHPAAFLREDTRVRIEDMRSDIRLAWSLATSSYRELPRWEILNNTDDAVSCINGIKNKHRRSEIGTVFYDIETDQYIADENEKYISFELFDPAKKIVGFSLSYDENFGFFIPLYHKESKVDTVIIEDVMREFSRLVPVGAHYGVFDLSWSLAKMGAKFKLICDTLLCSYLIYTKTRRHGLKGLLTELANYPLYTDEVDSELALLPREQRSMINVSLHALGKYCVIDSAGAKSLERILKPVLTNLGMDKLYNEIILPTTMWLVATQVRGAYIDLQKLYGMRDKIYPADMMNLYDRILNYPIVKNNNYKFSPTSPQEFSKLLFDCYGVPRHLSIALPPGKDGKVHYSISEPVQCDVIKYCREETASAISSLRKILFTEAANFAIDTRMYRKMGRIISGFNRLLQFVVPNTNKLIFNYLQHYTSTGRLSTRNYSIHTVPKNSDLRRLFISKWYDQGGLILGSDYSQLEPRVGAALSKDQLLTKAFKDKLDLHSYSALMCFKLDKRDPEIAEFIRVGEMRKALDLVGDRYPNIRDRSKEISFILWYGGGAETLSSQSELSVEESRKFIDQFLSTYKGVDNFIKAKHNEAITYGYVTTPLGMRFHFPDARLENGVRKSAALREAQDYPIQNLASTLTSHALVNIESMAFVESLQSYPWAFIHDEILADVYPGELLNILRIMKRVMEEDIPRFHDWLGDVPLEAEFKLGTRWEGGVSIKSIEDNVLYVEGKLRFFNDLVEHMKKSYQLKYEITKTWEDYPPDYLMLKKAYEGDVGGSTAMSGVIEVKSA